MTILTGHSHFFYLFILYFFQINDIIKLLWKIYLSIITLHYITLLLISILFFSCKSYETEICHITVESNDNCTYILEKESAPKYSFVKIQIKPKSAYYVSNLYNFYSDPLDFYKSTDEEDTYYFLVSDEDEYVDIKLKEKTTYSIGTLIDNGTINLSTTNTYEGDTVTFNISHDSYYYYDSSSVKVIKGSFYSYSEFKTYDTLEITKSSSNPNEYSFVMPDTYVTVYVPVKFGITSVKPRKSVYEYGEKVIFDIENHTPSATFDIYIDYRTLQDMIFSNVTLSNTLELPENFNYRVRTEKKLIICTHTDFYYDTPSKQIVVPFTSKLPTTNTVFSGE